MNLLLLLLFFGSFMLIAPALTAVVSSSSSSMSFDFRTCEPIQIQMCRGIGYNETSMMEHELQADVELTLQTYTPLIDYACSTQLRLFLCAAFVPMCTSFVPQPIGPCASLCESVRARCQPVLKGFGYAWPSTLDCNLFPKQNNHETMCMEGPTNEDDNAAIDAKHNDIYAPIPNSKLHGNHPAHSDCPRYKSHLYVKLHRSERCAQLCEANILFEQDDKHLSELWLATWTYATLGLAIVATLCLLLVDDAKTGSKWCTSLTPLLWTNNMVAVGWTVRFIVGRNSTACGYDPQLPNVLLLLVDGLSNAACTATFLLRYYFGMSACVWWAIFCLGWHRNVRRNTPELHGQHMALDLGSICQHSMKPQQQQQLRNAKVNYNIGNSSITQFVAWGLPGFQTAAVIVARWVDADELLGACFVGNQSDKGLQIFVATPLFCYWMFGTMNLISGYLAHRRNNQLLALNQQQPQYQQQQQQNLLKSIDSEIGTFLFVYCVPFGLLLLAVIYEFANIDIWQNANYIPIHAAAIPNAANAISTPLWPFLLRAFLELMLSVICSAWVLGPKLSIMYKRQMTPTIAIHKQNAKTVSLPRVGSSSRASNTAHSTVSYQSVRLPAMHRNKPIGALQQQQMNKPMSQHSLPRSKCTATPLTTHTYLPHKSTYKSSSSNNKQKQQKPQHFQHFGNETFL